MSRIGATGGAFTNGDSWAVARLRPPLADTTSQRYLEGTKLPPWDETTLKFAKSGVEVKAAIELRLHDLRSRLTKRDAELNEIMSDKERLRSYLLRDRERDSYYRSSQVKIEIPSEDHQRITELCTRMSLIEREIDKLSLISENTKDDQSFSLTEDELVTLGFGPRDSNP